MFNGSIVMKFINATSSYLDDIVRIENAGFNPEEAGSLSQYTERIQRFPETFLLAIDEQKTLLGFICGPAVQARFVEDWMYEDNPENIATGGHQTILTVAVSPEARGQGVGSQLLQALEKVAREQGRESIALTCLEDRIPFYEKNGYINRGESASQHANEQWYNLEKVL